MRLSCKIIIRNNCRNGNKETCGSCNQCLCNTVCHNRRPCPFHHSEIMKCPDNSKHRAKKPYKWGCASNDSEHTQIPFKRKKLLPCRKSHCLPSRIFTLFIS